MISAHNKQTPFVKPRTYEYHPHSLEKNSTKSTYSGNHTAQHHPALALVQRFFFDHNLISTKLRVCVVLHLLQLILGE